MRQSRIERSRRWSTRDCRTEQQPLELYVDPRDPDIVRAKRIRRAAARP